MTRHDDFSKSTLVRAHEAARVEVANLTCRLVAARNKLAAIERTLEARMPAGRAA